MPFAEGRGRVAVLAQHFRYQRRALGNGARIAGEVGGQIRDHAHAHGVVIASRQQRGARRRAQRGDVKARVAQSSGRQPVQRRRRNQAAECARLPVALIVQQHQQHVGRAGRRRNGRNGIGSGLFVRGSDGSAKRRRRNRQHGAVRLLRGSRMHRAQDARRGQRARILYGLCRVEVSGAGVCSQGFVHIRVACFERQAQILTISRRTNFTAGQAGSLTGPAAICRRVKR